MLDRLGKQDLVNLRVEDRGLPMHVAALAIIDGEPLREDDGSFRSDEVRAWIDGRLHLAPRLRQVVHRPGAGLGSPLWVDDPRFDVAAHVRVEAVAAPGDEAALLATCARLNRPPLDRSRSPWEMVFLTGLADGTVAMLIRLHHVIADGVASVAAFGALLDVGPRTHVGSAAPWIPAPIPSGGELLADRRRRTRARVDAAASSFIHPMTWLSRLPATARLLWDLIGEGASPRTSLNGPIGSRRRLQLVRADLERARSVAHAHRGTVNDVILAAVTNGARELLLGRAEPLPPVPLRASVPVSIRRPGDPPAQGNRVAVMIAPLPVGEPDPERRLEAIVRATSERKRRPRPQMGWDLGSAAVQGLMLRLMDRQRLVNLFVSNVPGPPVPLYMAGARILELFPVGVVQGNVTLGVGVLSYAGALDVTVVADADACPDADVFVRGMTRALEELGAVAPGSGRGADGQAASLPPAALPPSTSA
jgi:diacylglycerol O-acyltransferase